MKHLSALVLFLLFYDFCAVVEASTPYAIGIARDSDTSEILYKEKHYVERDDQGAVVKRNVIYEAPGGEKIATKVNTQGSARWAPEFELVDFRSRYREELRVSKDSFVLRLRERGEEVWQEITIPRTDDSQNWVADAGFDQFIRDHIEQLRQGKSIDFTFLSPARLSSVPFRLIPVEEANQRLRVKMVLQNRFLRLLLDPIVLDYTLESNLLMRFEGITNLSRVNGDHYEAIIEYRYE